MITRFHTLTRNVSAMRFLILMALVLASQSATAEALLPAQLACRDPRAPTQQRVDNCSIVLSDLSATSADRYAAYLNRARARFERREWTRSIEDYDAAINLQSDAPEIFNERGAARERNGEPDLAISDYSKAIEVNPNYARAFGNRGLSHYKRGAHDLAKADFDAAIRLDPQYLAALNGRGVVASLLGDHQGAIADFSAALQVDQNYASGYNNRGIAYLKRGQYELAIADLEQAIRLAPGNPDFHNELAWAYLRAGQPELGLPYVNRALELASNHAAAYDTRAAIHEALGNFGQANTDHARARASSSEAAQGAGRSVASASATPGSAVIADVIRFVQEQGWIARFDDICSQFETAEHDRACEFMQISVQETDGRGDPRGFNVSVNSTIPYIVIFHLGPLVGEFFVVSPTGNLLRAYYRSKGTGYTRVPIEEAQAEFQADLDYWTVNLARLKQGREQKREHGR